MNAFDPDKLPRLCGPCLAPASPGLPAGDAPARPGVLRRFPDARFDVSTHSRPADPGIFTPARSQAAGPVMIDPCTALGLLPQTLKHFGVSIEQFTGLRRVGDKEGGSAETSELGGVYVNSQNEKILIKAAEQPAHTFAELLNSILHRSFVPDGVKVVPLRIGGKTYLGSLYFKNCIDLYKYALETAGLPVPEKRPVVHLPGTGKHTRAVDDALRECASHITPSVVFSLLTGNFDPHASNILVERHAHGINKGKVAAAHLIDLGWGSRQTFLGGAKLGDLFGPELHPNSVLRRLPGIGPTNHIKDIPEDIRSSPLYIDQLIQLSAHDFRSSVELAFEQGKASFGPDVFASFAANAGLDIGPDEAADPESVKQAYLRRLGERQASMKRYAADLALGLFSLDKDPATGEVSLTACKDEHGRPQIHHYLTHPEIRAHIEQYVRQEPGGAKLRNHALDKYQDVLRFALNDLLQETAPAPASAHLRRPLRKM